MAKKLQSPRFEYYENVDKVASLLEEYIGEYDEILAEKILEELGITKGRKMIFELFEQNVKAVRIDKDGNATVKLTANVEEVEDEN
jgi:putative Mn2+ efflux pump MntP